MRCGYGIKIIKLTVAFLLLASQLPVSAQNDPLRHGYALIIGNWTYKDPRWAPLIDIQLQIQQLKPVLDEHFDGVEVLTNPTFDQLDNGLRAFLRSRGNDDNARLFIYYAGHGYTETDLSRNERRGYITATDTPYIDDGSPKGFSAARIKAISMEAIRGMVSDANARQILFIFDSCFAGTIFTARAPSSRAMQLSESDVQRLTGLPVREFITAGDYNQKIPAQSPLPRLLINALEGEADPYGTGVVSGTQLAQYFWAEMQNQNLTPREGKLPGGYFDRGEFLFRVIKRVKIIVHFKVSSWLNQKRLDMEFPDAEEMKAAASMMKTYPNSKATIDVDVRSRFTDDDSIIDNVFKGWEMRNQITRSLNSYGINSDRIVGGRNGIAYFGNSRAIIFIDR